LLLLLLMVIAHRLRYHYLPCFWDWDRHNLANRRICLCGDK
jgi:hypothetical protein